MKIKYFGYFETAEGTHNHHGYEFIDKETACRDMRKIARGNWLVGSAVRWAIYDQNLNEVASGTVR